MNEVWGANEDIYSLKPLIFIFIQYMQKENSTLFSVNNMVVCDILTANTISMEENMDIRYPDYYGKFKCIAGECPDTCCAGLEISVDRESEVYYRRMQQKYAKSNDIGKKRFAEKLKRHIQHGYIVGKGNTCPFLDHKGLCEIYKELGPSALCRTCSRHPRHLEDYGNLHEVVLLLSCPEAARLILWENEGGYHMKRVPERRGNVDGINSELLSLLLEVRSRVWKIGYNGEYSLDKRMALILAMCHDIQGCLNQDDLSNVREILNRRGTVRMTGERNARLLLMTDFMEHLAETDTISRPFMEQLELCRNLLYHSDDSRDRYEKDRNEFLESNPGIEREWENLFGYFVYSFFLGSLYDGDILGKIKLAILCTIAIEDLDLASWRQLGAIDHDLQLIICQGLARQIENSDENRESLEKVMGQRLFSSRRMIKALM